MEQTELETTIEAGFTSSDLIASAYNAIAAMEIVNVMTNEQATKKAAIVEQSIDIIEICIKELHTYANS